MSAIFSRLLLLSLGLVLGGLGGEWLGGLFRVPETGRLLGAVGGVLLVSLADSLRGHRLMSWLRGAQDGAAPRDAGFWGEMGYRIERALRARERAVAQERERLSQFLSAIEASPNGVLLLDPEDHITWCSRVAADHLGLDPQRDLGQAITNLVRAPAFVAHLQAHSDEPVTLRLPGRDATLSVLIRPYGQGQRLVLSQDVTERLRADGMRRDFVANVSHEIRTPLTVLAGFVETLGSLPLTEPERQRVMALMKQQTDRMQALVADLLTLAQLEGSPRPPTDRWVPVATLLQRVRGDGATLSAGRHQLLVPDVPEVAALAGNESELLSALANLVNNAIRYTPEGGTVRVGWSLRADGAGVLEVADTGLGIAREHLPRLTERFYRVDGSRSRDTGGTGLGLSIVKHAVQRHGGELEIESEPGRGSRFRLVLPAARVRSQREDELSAATAVG